MDYKNEKQVANAAVRKLETALRASTSGFGSHIRGEPRDQSLKEATAVARVKRYGKGRGKVKTYMTRLSVKMGRHGFIQHYGVKNLRQSGSRIRKQPKETAYNYAAHHFNMKPQPFINGAINHSDVISFVMENISKIRSEEIIFEIRDIMTGNNI